MIFFHASFTCQETSRGSIQMDFFSVDPLVVSVAFIGTLVFALAGVVAWLYWQQMKLFTNMNTIIAAFADVQAVPEPPPPPPVEEDDRASVEDDSEPVIPDVVDGPPPPLDTDSLEAKTKKELQEILTKRGIPFGRADSKTVLLSLLKATA